MSLEKKYNSIDQSKLKPAVRDILKKMKEKSENFTNSDINKKVEPALDKLLMRLEKELPEAIKKATKTPSKPKAKPKAKAKAKPKTKSTKETFTQKASKLMKKEGISWAEAKNKLSKQLKDEKDKVEKDIKSDNKQALNELDKLIKSTEFKKDLGKFPKKSSGEERELTSDISADGKRQALPRGKRKSKNGKTYYEYRDNRSDVNSLPAPKGQYRYKGKTPPYLEAGGTLPTPFGQAGLVGETGTMNEVDLFAMGGGLPQGVHQYYGQTYNPAYPTPHGYAKGGRLSARTQFSDYDFDKLSYDFVVFNDRVETEDGKVVGTINSKGHLVAKGDKTLKNPLVKWLQQNSYVSNDEYYKLAKGGDIPVGFHKMPNGEIMADSEHLAEGGETIDGFTLNTIKGVANKPTNVDIDKLDINYAEGGEIDLFEDYEKQPKELSEIVETYQERYADGDMDYESTKEFLGKVNAIGYTFDSGLDNEPFGLRKMAKGGVTKKFPIAVKRRIDEINLLLPKVEDASNFAGGYFGSTMYSYVVLTKPIEIRNNYVYIPTQKNSPNNYPFEKRYNVNNKDEYDANGLKGLKYDLGIILKAFKQLLRDEGEMAKGGEIDWDDNVTVFQFGKEKDANDFFLMADKFTDYDVLRLSPFAIQYVGGKEGFDFLYERAENYESNSLDIYAKGGRTKHSLMQDRRRVSSEPWEVAYQKRKAKMEAGGTLPTPFGQAGLVGETGTMNEVDLFAMGGGLPQGVHQYYAQTYNPAYPTPHGYAKGGKTDGDTLGDFKKRLLELGDKEFVEYKEKQLKNRQDLYYAFQDRLKDVHKQTIVIKDDLPFAKGGKIGFDGLAKKVAKKYEGKPVKADFQSEYGKTYSKAEAMEVGKKVAGKVYQQQQSMAKGGLTDSKYIPSYEIYEVVTKDGKVYENDYSAMEFLSGAYVSDKVVTKPEDKDGSQMTLFDKGGKIPKGAIYIKRRDIDYITIGDEDDRKDEGDKEKVDGKNLFNGFWIDPIKQKTLIAEATKDGRLGKSSKPKTKYKGGKNKDYELPFAKGGVIMFGSKWIKKKGSNSTIYLVDNIDGDRVFYHNMKSGRYYQDSKSNFKKDFREKGSEGRMVLLEKGGKTQGYNDKLDESLGNTKGKSSSKEQNYKDRRNESEAMENKGSKRKYSSVKTMDKGNRSKRRTPMSLAKEIRKEGENWQQAVKRASAILKKEYADK